MTSMKMSWHSNGRLAGGWVKSAATEPFHPAWIESSYPSESIAGRRSPKRLAGLSTFGKPRYDFGKRSQ
jgi:hypothetical protein